MGVRLICLTWAALWLRSPYGRVLSMFGMGRPMLSDALRRPQMPSDAARCSKMPPDTLRSSQMLSDALRLGVLKKNRGDLKKNKSPLFVFKTLSPGVLIKNMGSLFFFNTPYFFLRLLIFFPVHSGLAPLHGR